ncbi:MAP kinase-interacting serine/threonine-protein kinase 2-like [Apostichopus japonicus]|uniref:MAP kinase-interacting serine/threonine-protein kinase 2-like n=1 Tax=Stichopus japonicus TaxID=307972 RepID=UPI003AB2CD68
MPRIGIRTTNQDCLILLFTKSQFSNVELIGVGSYGKVFRVKQGSKHYVVKELASTGKREASLFKKEAALLQSLAGHENIVRIHGFSLTEHAMLLGYESFDFSKVGISHEPVHCLKDYLQAVDKLNKFSGFHHTQYHLAKDICAGTRFLHERGIAHRDLKPDNILISNNHYVTFPDVDVQIWWASKPITARLIDFGESRSTLLQTSSLNQTSTSNLYRGSPAYMVPEALLGRADRASLYDLQNMDLWSLGMTLFSLINPDLPYPYALEIEERQGCRTVDVFKECIETGLLPKL